nr:twin-arginine translocase subunit TatC [Alphaproteobacteria bacterium]
MKMTLVQHFAELRRRILWVALVFVVGFGVGWLCAPAFQAFLTRPLMAVWPNGTMLYTGLADGLMIQFSLATGIALMAAAPAALWHLWAFVAPGLKQNEKNVIWPVMLMSPVLF